MKIKSISDNEILFDDDRIIKFIPHSKDTEVYIEISKDISGYEFKKVNIKIDRSTPDSFILTGGDEDVIITTITNQKDFINVLVGKDFYCGQYVEGVT